MSAMKTLKPLSILLLGCLAACNGQNLTAPSGVSGITPKSGPWQVVVDTHPELSGTFTFNFVTDQGPAKLQLTTATGKTVEAPLKWASGNFDIYVNYPVDTSGYIQSDKLSLAILSDTKASLPAQYKALIATEGVDVSFTEDGIRAVARIAAEVNGEIENIGARRLQTVMEKLLEEVSFDAEDR